MTVDGTDIAHTSALRRRRRIVAISIAVALVIGGSTTASAATAQASAKALAKANAEAAVILEQKLVLHRTAALGSILPMGQVLVDDARAWSASASALLTAADTAALLSTAESLSDSLARTPNAEASSSELEAAYDAQWTMILGARERMTPIVAAAAAVAKTYLDASPIADTGSRQAVVDSTGALEAAWQNHSSIAEPLTNLTSAVTNVVAAQEAAIAAAAAAAAAEAARVAAAAAVASKGGGYHPGKKSTGGGGGAAASGGGGSGAAPSCNSDVLTCVNQIRAYNGLGGLSSNGTLNQASQACANRMAGANSMTHSGATPGFGYWGENIAQGYGSAASVFNAWMNSAGHRANILNPSYTKMGLGYVSGGSWWCQQFGS